MPGKSARKNFNEHNSYQKSGKTRLSINLTDLEELINDPVELTDFSVRSNKELLNIS